MTTGKPSHILAVVVIMSAFVGIVGCTNMERDVDNLGLKPVDPTSDYTDKNDRKVNRFGAKVPMQIEIDSSTTITSNTDALNDSKDVEVVLVQKGCIAVSKGIYSAVRNSITFRPEQYLRIVDQEKLGFTTKSGIAIRYPVKLGYSYTIYRIARKYKNDSGLQVWELSGKARIVDIHKDEHVSNALSRSFKELD